MQAYRPRGLQRRIAQWKVRRIAERNISRLRRALKHSARYCDAEGACERAAASNMADRIRRRLQSVRGEEGMVGSRAQHRRRPAPAPSPQLCAGQHRGWKGGADGRRRAHAQGLCGGRAPPTAALPAEWAVGAVAFLLESKSREIMANAMRATLAERAALELCWLNAEGYAPGQTWRPCLDRPPAGAPRMRSRRCGTPTQSRAFSAGSALAWRRP